MTGTGDDAAYKAEVSSAGSNASFWSADAALGTAQNPALAPSTGEGINDSPEFQIRQLLPRHGPICSFDNGRANVAYVHAITDYIYASANVATADLQKHDVRIISEDYAGLGDLYFGVKIARILKRRLPELSSVAVNWVHQPKKSTTDLGIVFNDLTVVDMNDTSMVKKDDLENKIIIYGPTQNSTISKGSYASEHVIIMSEYGDSDRLGNVNALPQKWRAIPAGAKSEEYGLLLEPPESMDQYTINTDNPILANRINPGNYLFAYVNRHHTAVIKFIHNYFGANQFPTVVFAGSDQQYKTLTHALNKYAESHPVQFRLSYFKEKFGTVEAGNETEFVIETLHPQDQNLPVKGKPGEDTEPAKKTRRRVEIILQRMTNRQFVATLANSMQLRIVTGDQSLSEALSLSDSIVMYEELGHKSNLFRSLGNWSKERPMPLFNLFRTGSDGIAAIKQGNPEWQNSLNALQENLNLEHRIVGAVKGCVFRERLASIREIDRQITELARKGKDLDEIYPLLKELAVMLGVAQQ